MPEPDAGKESRVNDDYTLQNQAARRWFVPVEESETPSLSFSTG